MFSEKVYYNVWWLKGLNKKLSWDYRDWPVNELHPVQTSEPKFNPTTLVKKKKKLVCRYA